MTMALVLSAHRALASGVVAHAGDVRTPAAVFREIFTVFLGLGTLVGVVVVSYTAYNAYAYREGSGRGERADVDRPELGELPAGGGGGRKLFLSFGISAVIVLSLIAWTYMTLLYIETGPDDRAAQENAITVDVEGFQFGWQFEYPNGETASTLRVPVDRLIRLNVTSRDVFHNFGSPELRVKTDAIPGQTTTTWFVAKETGEYEAQCYELCGAGHSYMNATIDVMQRDDYRSWYANTTGESA